MRKILLLIVLASLIFLIACQPVVEDTEAPVTEETVSSEEAEITETLEDFEDLDQLEDDLDADFEELENIELE